MRQLIVQEWISLDGFTSDQNDKLHFFAHTVREVYADDHHKPILETIDCILLGRKTYEQFAGVWPTRSTEGDLLALKMNTAEKIVFSGSIAKAPWGKWKEGSVEKGDPIACVRKLKLSLGKNIVVWGSIALVQLLVQNNLVDELHLFVSPVITGGGRKLFPEAVDPVSLTLRESKQYNSGVVLLSYQNKNLKL